MKSYLVKWLIAIVLAVLFLLVEFGNGLSSKRSVSHSSCPDTGCGSLSF